MKKQSYIVIGLSVFGQHIVRALSHTSVELLVIDRDARKLEEFANFALNSICADAAEPDVLNQLGVSGFDGAVVAIEHNLESSVLITMQLKELGVPNVIVKAASEIEGRVLRRVGADKVIQPDREMGIRIANQIAGGKYFEAIELPQDYDIIDFAVPSDWFDHTIRELGIRANFEVTVIGIRRDDALFVNPSPDFMLESGDIAVLLGSRDQLNGLLDPAGDIGPSIPATAPSGFSSGAV